MLRCSIHVEVLPGPAGTIFDLKTYVADCWFHVGCTDVFCEAKEHIAGAFVKEQEGIANATSSRGAHRADDIHG